MKLQQLMKWVIAGPRTQLMVKREEEIEKCSQNLAQHVVSSLRTKRQLTYEPKANHNVPEEQGNTAHRRDGTCVISGEQIKVQLYRSEVDTLNDMQLVIS